MSFYRTLLAAVAAIVIASPVFADDTATTEAMTNGTTVQQATEATDTTAAATMEQTKINLNKATVKELMKVKGLNASKARSIVAYRKKHGDFKSTDDLTHVKGFKKMKAESLKEIADQLTIE